MFKKIIILILTVIILSTKAIADGVTKIGIIVPLKHKAMEQIVEGFRNNLPKNLEIIELNAQGDPTLMKSIIEKLKHQQISIVAPIGTSAAQMAISSLGKSGKIVAIAANITEAQRLSNKLGNFTGVIDELIDTEISRFIAASIPEAKKLTIIRSNDARIYDSSRDFIRESERNGIKIQDLAAQSMADIYSLVKTIDRDSSAIIIFKDHMVVSAIGLLMQKAKQLGIPVISMDEGSFEEGADLAIGVRESDIGIAAADKVKALLGGADIANLPVSSVSKVRLFYRDHSRINSVLLKANALSFGYQLEEAQ